jgi:hypothetical protein
MRVIMTAADCSPVVASRRAKYDGDIRVHTLLGAQPLHTHFPIAVPDYRLSFSKGEDYTTQSPDRRNFSSAQQRFLLTPQPLSLLQKPLH